MWENFLCLLNSEKFSNIESYVKILEKLDYDLLIIDAYHMGKGFQCLSVGKAQEEEKRGREDL